MNKTVRILIVISDPKISFFRAWETGALCNTMLLILTDRRTNVQPDHATLKWGDWKCETGKWRTRNAGVENARVENVAQEMQGWKMRDWKIEHKNVTDCYA